MLGALWNTQYFRQSELPVLEDIQYSAQWTLKIFGVLSISLSTLTAKESILDSGYSWYSRELRIFGNRYFG